MNYEPSSLGGLKEAPKAGKDHTPHYNADLVRQKIDRTNNFQQAGERYRTFEQWEKDELILNLVNTLKPAQKHIQDKMISLFSQCDEEYGRRVAEGLQQTSGAMQNGSMGADHKEDAVKEAEAVSTEAKPY